MRIRVDEIPESGRIIRFHWVEDRLNQYLPPDDPFELKLAKPVNVELEIRKEPDHIKIEGSIRGTLQMACHRCLSPFLWPLDEKIDVILVSEAEVPEEEETELETDELEYDFFDGEIIEIDDLVAEQIFLSLPYKVLCSEECRGLCPRCGTNLNEEECKCPKSGENPAFSGLKSIRDRLPGSEEE